MEKKRLSALLPIGVFLILYLGFGILFEYVLKTEEGFYGDTGDCGLSDRIACGGASG